MTIADDTGRATKILLVGASWGHMGSHSGLAPLALFLGTFAEIRRPLPTRWDKMSRRVRSLRNKLLMRSDPVAWSPFHGMEQRMIERVALREATRFKPDWILFEAIEDHFNDIRYVRSKLPKVRIAGISHQPPAWWRLFVRAPEPLRDLDRVFVLARDAQSSLCATSGCRDVRHIPHGVDEAFFKPEQPLALPAEGPINIVFSGQWLRDFDLLSAVAARSAELPRPVHFHLVVPMGARTLAQHYRLAKLRNISWHSGLSDDQLLALYRSSHIAFLPLIDATANNGLLEAMSSQIPIVVSDTGGVRDYVSPDQATLFEEGNVDAALTALSACVADYDASLRKAEAARRRVVQELDWPIVARTMAAMLDISKAG